MELEKLLVLKAFYLGRALAQRHESSPDAIKLVESAVRQLDTQTCEDAGRLAIFYTLLQAEILRPNFSDRLRKRQEAKSRSAAANSPMYDYYMLIESATEGQPEGRDPPKKVRHGITHIREVKPSFWFWEKKLEVESGESVVDVACDAIDVDESRISKKESDFLHRYSLKEVLALHRISIAP